MIALGSLELRHLPTIEAGPPQPMIEQSRMVSNVFPGLKLCPKEEGDLISLRILLYQVGPLGNILAL
jgi:hypothetical protein